MSAWRYAVVAGALVVCGVACTQSPVPQTQPVQRKLELQGFGSCSELETYIEDTAVLDMTSSLEQAKKGGYGWGPVFMGGVVENSAGAPNAASSPQASGPANHTTTNVQVQGVDEADFVKNDGTRIFVLSGDTLYINDSWPANELKTVATKKIDGWPLAMFLDEKNHVVIFSSIWDAYPLDKTRGADLCASMSCGYYYSNTVKVTVLDVSTLSAPVVKDEYFLPGSYSNARRIGSSVRMVVSDSFRYPEGVRFWIDSQDPTLYEDRARMEKEYDKLIDANEKLIRAASINDWLPPAKRRLAGGQMEEVGYECTDFYKSNAPTKLGLVTVATLNLDAPAQALSRTSIVAEPGEIYASGKNLYIASQHWWWWPEAGQADHTYLHKFDITDPNAAKYVASGGVDGRIVDQFSMDEDKNGYFRVATTITTRVEDTENPDNWWGRFETVNRVSVLAENNGELPIVGQTEDLAPGERVMSSRFVDDKGFVVTFRQVDPLFTIDLSDPTNPKKIGELKVEGFSSYIHPLDATHLLTIGQYIDADGTWSSRSVQIAIYDVSDLANPKQTFTRNVGSMYGYSEALWDHHAFNYFPAKGLLAVPFYDWHDTSGRNGSYWDSFTSDLRVFSIDVATGITPKGAVSMKDMYMTSNDYGWSYYWSPWIRRSVMADDFVYAISDSGIRVANIADLSMTVATAQFYKAVEK